MPKAIIRPSPPTKLHQMRVVPSGEEHSILAISTEDGRIIFYDLKTTVESERRTKKYRSARHWDSWEATKLDSAVESRTLRCCNTRQGHL